MPRSLLTRAKYGASRAFDARTDADSSCDLDEVEVVLFSLGRKGRLSETHEEREHDGDTGAIAEISRQMTPRVHLAHVKLHFSSAGLLGIPRASEICSVKPLKAISSQFKFPPPFRLENEQDEREMKLRDVSSWIAAEPRAASAKFHSLAGGREEIIFSMSLREGAFVLPPADGPLMGFQSGP